MKRSGSGAPDERTQKARGAFKENSVQAVRGVVEDKVIKIASLNIQGACQNAAYVHEALPDCDIVCLQEHCLMSYEIEEMTKCFPNHLQHSRCVDEDQQPEHGRRTGGHGGVTTMWKQRLNPYAERHEDGNSRIAVTTFTIPGSPLCIINCYLPSGNSKEAVTLFREDLDKLHHLIDKFGETFEVVVIGDLNEDHFHRFSAKENLTKDLIDKFALLDLGLTSSNENTYINPHLNHKSHIDHVLVKHSNLSTAWEDVCILSDKERVKFNQLLISRGSDSQGQNCF